MRNTIIHCFIKFGSKQTITDLYENGTIYCNPVQYFRTLEDKFRGDSYEGASFIKNYPPGKFTISIDGKEIDHEFNYLNFHVKEAYEKTLGNIYSLYCLSSKVLQGIDPVEGNRYRVPSIKGKEFSGYHLLAYYYVSWKLAVPGMLAQLGLPFDDEYILAEQMYKPKQ